MGSDEALDDIQAEKPEETRGDGEAFSGTIFEFQDDGMVAGLSELSAKLTGLGCGEQTHEPLENLAMLAA